MNVPSSISSPASSKQVGGFPSEASFECAGDSQVRDLRTYDDAHEQAICAASGYTVASTSPVA